MTGSTAFIKVGDSLLWVKDSSQTNGNQSLQRGIYIRDLESYFQNKNIPEPIENLFADCAGHILDTDRP